MSDNANIYLLKILQKYQARNLAAYSEELKNLKNIIKSWAGTCGFELKGSGSRAKDTAISIASDVDVLVSMSADCNRSKGLKSIYDSLHVKLKNNYSDVRKQNVSFRILLRDLEVDITPARKHLKSTNYHWLYVSKKDSWQQTNIQKHIDDISKSGRTNEIKLLKIWREINGLDFPSIYLEYLLVNNILLNKSKDASSLGDNVLHVLSELAKTASNPIYARVVDPANSANILSDLLTDTEKDNIINQAQISISQSLWENIIW